MYEYEHDAAILTARQLMAGKYIVLDTETTSLKDAEVVQIGYVLETGERDKVLVKPSKPITPAAEAIHHISNDMVAHEPDMYAVWQGRLRQLFTMRTTVGYNVGFDVRALQHSLHQYNIIWPIDETIDVMLLYSAVRGVHNIATGTPKWYKLSEACAYLHIEYEGIFHDALFDASCTRAVLEWITNEQTYWELALDAADELILGKIEVAEYAKIVADVTYRKKGD
jgi:DNA polymerase III epsilon subunit-like protein